MPTYHDKYSRSGFTSSQKKGYTKCMKALHFLGKQQLQFVDVPEPTIDENDVLMKIKKVGICGTDLHI